MLEILDAIIATGAIVLAISLIVQAVQQIIKQFFSLKSSYMERELVMMFLSDDVLKKFFDKWTTMAEKLTPDWKIIKTIPQSEREIVEALKIKLRSIGYKDLEMIENISTEQMRIIVKGLPMFNGMSETGDNLLAKTLRDVTDWFEISKKAFQDHYERKMKIWAIAISTVLVLALNANIFEIYKDFSQNKIVRDAAITWAGKITTQPRDSVLTIKKPGLKDSIVLKHKADTLIVAEIKKNLSDIKTLVNNNSFQLMRWNNQIELRGEGWELFGGILKMIFGWIGMILLVSLGAPFWYDLLKSLMGIKNQLKIEKKEK